LRIGLLAPDLAKLTGPACGPNWLVWLTLKLARDLLGSPKPPG